MLVSVKIKVTFIQKSDFQSYLIRLMGVKLWLGCDKNNFKFEFNLSRAEDHWSTSDNRLF